MKYLVLFEELKDGRWEIDGEQEYVDVDDAIVDAAVFASHDELCRSRVYTLEKTYHRKDMITG